MLDFRRHCDGASDAIVKILETFPGVAPNRWLAANGAQSQRPCKLLEVLMILMFASQKNVTELQ